MLLILFKYYNYERICFNDMTPYELRERLKRDVPEVTIYPILTNPYYSEEKYQDVLKDQLKLKKTLKLIIW